MLYLYMTRQNGSQSLIDSVYILLVITISTYTRHLQFSCKRKFQLCLQNHYSLVLVFYLGSAWIIPLASIYLRFSFATDMLLPDTPFEAKYSAVLPERLDVLKFPNSVVLFLIIRYFWKSCKPYHKVAPSSYLRFSFEYASISGIHRRNVSDSCKA